MIINLGEIGMNPILFVIIFAICILAGMLLFLELGRYIGLRQKAKDQEGGREGLGAVEGAIFGLLGLLIAFTFSGAAARFDTRRQLIVEEANAIGTAYLRIDLLPPGAQPGLREIFRQYVDARLRYRAYQISSGKGGARKSHGIPGGNMETSRHRLPAGSFASHDDTCYVCVERDDRYYNHADRCA
jgi:hypothetical protein